MPAFRGSKEIFGRKNRAANAPGRNRTPISRASGKEKPMLTTNVAISTMAMIQTPRTISVFFISADKDS